MVPTDLSELPAVVAELERRIEVLERREAGSPTSPTAASGADDTFWALNGLRERLGWHESTRTGAVLVTGSLTLPTGEPVEWQEGAPTSELLDSDWSPMAPGLDALSHPVRLELLRQVLNGVRSTADLAATESLGSTGQLHHHLRHLVGSGWLRQRGRGSYEVSPTRVIPLLVILTAVQS